MFFFVAIVVICETLKPKKEKKERSELYPCTLYGCDWLNSQRVVNFVKNSIWKWTTAENVNKTVEGITPTGRHKSRANERNMHSQVFQCRYNSRSTNVNLKERKKEKKKMKKSLKLVIASMDRNAKCWTWETDQCTSS